MSMFFRTQIKICPESEEEPRSFEKPREQAAPANNNHFVGPRHAPKIPEKIFIRGGPDRLRMFFRRPLTGAIAELEAEENRLILKLILFWIFDDLN